MSKEVKYNDFIYGYGTSGYSTSRIINWKFVEKEDYRRVGLFKKEKCLMMFIEVKTTNGTYDNDGFEQKSELMIIINKELRLNLKLQHGILK